jgi:hypothetical protein
VRKTIEAQAGFALGGIGQELISPANHAVNAWLSRYISISCA